MKRFISIIFALCIVLCLCSCGKTISVKVVSNEKAEKIEESLGTVSVEKVFDDIKKIDLYLDPDFDSEKYTVKTETDSESSTKDIHYYSGDTLVYTKYEGYGEEGFAFYTKTASGLDATVKYYTYSDNIRTVGIETAEYTLFANRLDKNDPHGMSDTNITLFSKNSDSVFESEVNYHYNNGEAVFDSVTYLEDGNYQRYNYYIDGDGNEDEYTDVLVNGKKPQTSDGIIKVLQSDESYKYAAVKIAGSDKWYCSEDKWYVEAELAIAMDSKKQAEEYIKKNNLDATVDDYGSYVVKVEKAVLPIDKNAVLSDGKLPSFIIGVVDDSYFDSITLNADGVITKLGPADISIY